MTSIATIKASDLQALNMALDAIPHSEIMALVDYCKNVPRLEAASAAVRVWALAPEEARARIFAKRAMRKTLADIIDNAEVDVKDE